jgi:proteic killer suppression protein
MIRSFRHKGIEKFFLTGSKAGIQPAHAAKLFDQLGALNVATRPEHMKFPGWQFHALSGDLTGHWAVSIPRQSRGLYGVSRSKRLERGR